MKGKERKVIGRGRWKIRKQGKAGEQAEAGRAQGWEQAGLLSHTRSLISTWPFD